MAMAFTNAHLSYSRLAKFETCPLSFKLHYIDKLPSASGIEARLGRAIHWVLQHLVGEAASAWRYGALSEERALDLLRRAWANENLTGVSVFHDATTMLQGFIEQTGALDPRTVLALEHEFRVRVGRFAVIGYMDRVDQLDDETIEIVDYKTMRQLMTRDEADTSLQMSIYALAARELWPWAKNVKLTFWFLRQRVRISTTRTAEQLETARSYIETLGEQTERAKAFPPRIHGGCAFCDHRHHCDAYADALKGKRATAVADPEKLEEVAKEREEVASLSKILFSRQKELDGILKAKIAEDGDQELGGVRYAVINSARTTYPLHATLNALVEASGMAREDLIDRIAMVDSDALDALYRDLRESVPKTRLNLLKMEIDAQAIKSYSPRIQARPMVTA
jgi:putative RecB family exonuclease